MDAARPPPHATAACRRRAAVGYARGHRVDTRSRHRLPSRSRRVLGWTRSKGRHGRRRSACFPDSGSRLAASGSTSRTSGSPRPARVRGSRLRGHRPADPTRALGRYGPFASVTGAGRTRPLRRRAAYLGSPPHRRRAAYLGSRCGPMSEQTARAVARAIADAAGGVRSSAVMPPVSPGERGQRSPAVRGFSPVIRPRAGEALVREIQPATVVSTWQRRVAAPQSRFRCHRPSGLFHALSQRTSPHPGDRCTVTVNPFGSSPWPPATRRTATTADLPANRPAMARSGPLARWPAGSKFPSRFTHRGESPRPSDDAARTEVRP